MKKFTKFVAAVWIGIVVAAIVIVLISVTNVYAEDSISASVGLHIEATSDQQGPRPMPPMRQEMKGKVTGITGTTLTVISFRPDMGTSTIFTVDASSSIVIKNDATSSVSQIAVGDMILVHGPIIGTTIAARQIVDGVGPMKVPPMMNASSSHRGGNATATQERKDKGEMMGSPSGATTTATGTTTVQVRENLFLPIGRFFTRIFGRFHF